MKKILITTILTLPLIANANNFIEVGVGYQQIENNFNSKTNSTISNYSTSNSDSNAIPYVQYSYQYKNFITKTEQDDLLFGYKDNKIQVALFTNLSNRKETTWKNPYALNSSREKTKEVKNGLSFKYTIKQTREISNKISYKFTSIDVENETVSSDLQRDANNHLITFNSRIQKNILYNISYENNDAVGKENNYSTYGVGLGYTGDITKGINYTILANYSLTKYSNTNSILNTKIDSKNIRFVAMSTWKNPYNWKNKYIKVLYVNENANANHDFYDKKSQLFIVNMGFKF